MSESLMCGLGIPERYGDRNRSEVYQRRKVRTPTNPVHGRCLNGQTVGVARLRHLLAVRTREGVYERRPCLSLIILDQKGIPLGT